MRSHPLYVPCARTRPATARTVSIVSATANNGVGGVFYSVSASVAGIALELRTTPGGVIAATATIGGSSGTGTIGSGLTGDYVLRATVPGAAAAVSGTVTVAYGSEVTPDVEDDFESYTSTANFLTDPLNKYYAFEQSLPNAALTLETGDATYGKFARYTWYPVEPPGTDITISFAPNWLPDNCQEVWIETAIRLSENFSIESTAPGGAALKSIRIVIPDGIGGGYISGFGSGDAGCYMVGGPDDDPAILEDSVHDVVWYRSTSPGWHIQRMHCKNRVVWEMWLDGVKVLETPTPNTLAASLWWVRFGANLNLQPNVLTIYRDWGYWKMWFDANDPGWE